jgi:uncharacterized protein YjbI with pentapeptide repeats
MKTMTKFVPAKNGFKFHNKFKDWVAFKGLKNAVGLDLTRSDVHGSDFRQANLSMANLTNAKGNGADFSKAQ